MLQSIYDQLVAQTPDAPVSRVVVGPTSVGVLSRHLGIATLSEKKVSACAVDRKASLKQLAGYIHSSDPFLVSLGAAAIHSGLPIPEHAQALDAKRLLTAEGQGKRVAAVGHFPFLDTLRNDFAGLEIFERHPLPGDFHESEIPRRLQNAEVVALTGLTLLNRTFEKILSHVAPKARVLVIGPSTPLSPLLFDYPVDALCGLACTEDPEPVLERIRQGEKFRNLAGVQYLTLMRSSYGS